MSDKIQLTITPDLKTRESVMLAAGRAQFAVTDHSSGYTCYLKLEAKEKDRPGETRRYAPAPLDRATHVFISEKGYGTTRIGTYYPPREGYDTGRVFLNVSPNCDHVDALHALVRHVNGHEVPDQYGIEVESRCGLCGRKLTDPESIRRGIGPECAGSVTGTRILHASAFATEDAPEPAPLVEMEPAPTLEPLTPAEAADYNMADLARVELGLDLGRFDDRQLSVLLFAALEENQIRAARKQVAA